MSTRRSIIRRVAENSFIDIQLGGQKIWWGDYEKSNGSEKKGGKGGS